MSEGDDFPEKDSSKVRFLFLDSSCNFLMANSLSMLAGSLSQSCIRMKGSRPLMLSMCHGFGFDKSSDTEPCDSPSTASPNSFYPVLFANSSSFTLFVIWVVSNS